MGDVHVDCANCGITFCLTRTLYERRSRDGRDFWCPNGHVNVYRPTEDQKRIAELEAEVASQEDVIAYLRHDRDELMAQREELVAALKECPGGCGWRSRRQVARDPVAMGRGLERVRRDVAEHLVEAHGCRPIEAQRLLPERTP